MRDIARHTLGTGERCSEVYKLNPGLHAEDTLAAGTVVHLPPDACLPAEEVEGLKPLPAMRPTTAPAKPKSVMALTGPIPATSTTSAPSRCRAPSATSSTTPTWCWCRPARTSACG